MSARKFLSMFIMRASIFPHSIEVGQPFSFATGNTVDSNPWRLQTGENTSSGATKPKGLEGLELSCDYFLACAVIFKRKADGLGGRQLSQKGHRFSTALQ